jgi:hypothetical protein
MYVHTQVEITDIRKITTRRRLLGTSVNVDFKVCMQVHDVCMFVYVYVYIYASSDKHSVLNLCLSE